MEEENRSLRKMVKKLNKTIDEKEEELKITRNELEKARVTMKSYRTNMFTQAHMDDEDCAIFVNKDIKYLLIKKERRTVGTLKHKELLTPTAIGWEHFRHIQSLRHQVQPTKDEKKKMRTLMKSYKLQMPDQEFQKSGGYHNIELFHCSNYLRGDRAKFKKVADELREEIKTKTKIGVNFVKLKKIMDKKSVIE